MSGQVITAIMVRETTRRTLTEARAEHPARRRPVRRLTAGALRRAAHALDPQAGAVAPA